jgi:hypothetical protein
MLSDAERASHARRDGRRLGRKVLAEVAAVARPDTILAWYRKLVARKFLAHGLIKVRADRGSSARWSN